MPCLGCFVLHGRTTMIRLGCQIGPADGALNLKALSKNDGWLVVGFQPDHFAGIPERRAG